MCNVCSGLPPKLLIGWQFATLRKLASNLASVTQISCYSGRSDGSLRTGSIPDQYNCVTPLGHNGLVIESWYTEQTCTVTTAAMRLSQAVSNLQINVKLNEHKTRLQWHYPSSPNSFVNF